MCNSANSCFTVHCKLHFSGKEMLVSVEGHPALSTLPTPQTLQKQSRLSRRETAGEVGASILDSNRLLHGSGVTHMSVIYMGLQYFHNIYSIQ